MATNKHDKYLLLWPKASYGILLMQCNCPWRHLMADGLILADIHGAIRSRAETVDRLVLFYAAGFHPWLNLCTDIHDWLMVPFETTLTPLGSAIYLYVRLGSISD